MIQAIISQMNADCFHQKRVMLSTELLQCLQQYLDAIKSTFEEQASVTGESQEEQINMVRVLGELRHYLYALNENYLHNTPMPEVPMAAVMSAFKHAGFLTCLNGTN